MADLEALIVQMDTYSGRHPAALIDADITDSGLLKAIKGNRSSTKGGLKVENRGDYTEIYPAFSSGAVRTEDLGDLKGRVTSILTQAGLSVDFLNGGAEDGAVIVDAYSEPEKIKAIIDSKKAHPTRLVDTQLGTA